MFQCFNTTFAGEKGPVIISDGLFRRRFSLAVPAGTSLDDRSLGVVYSRLMV